MASTAGPLYPLYTHLSGHAPLDTGGLYLSAIMNYAAVNICVKPLCEQMFSILRYRGVEPGSYGNCPSLLEELPGGSPWPHYLTSPPAPATHASASYGHPGGREAAPHCGFDVRFPTITEHLLVCFLATCRPSLEKCSNPFPIFKSGSLNILDYKPLPDA